MAGREARRTSGDGRPNFFDGLKRRLRGNKGAYEEGDSRVAE